MIGISNKTVYAVEALYILGSSADGKLMKIRDIASQSGISQNFLEQILLELRKNGFLLSVKGANGGYRLAKPLSDILLREIVNTLENDPFGVPARVGNPVIDLFWKERSSEIKKAFDLPLSELFECEQRINNTINYMI